MTSSRSSTSKNSLLVALAMLVMLVGVAHAGRKRVVVLEFEGPKAEKFHDDVVKLLKKHHTVISADKWEGTADELDAGKVTEKNVKKVARKLKIDGVITGKIEKRRDEYIIRIKLRAGTSGELVGGSIDTKADGPRLDGHAQSDLKDELIGQIDELEANHGGGGDDDEVADRSSKKKHGDDDEGDDDDRSSKKKKHGDDDEGDDDRRAFSKSHAEKGRDSVDDDDHDRASKKKKHDDDDDDRVSKKKHDDEDDDRSSKKKHGDDDDDEVARSSKHDDDDDSPLPRAEKKKHGDDDRDDSDDGDDDDDRGGKRHKKVASKDDDDDDDDGGSVEDSDDGPSIDRSEALSPAHRAIDVTAGLSFTGRNLGFQYKSTLAMTSPPPGYKQAIPVAGAMFDATFFPLAFGHKNKSITANIGAEVLYDKAIKINSQKRYLDAQGAGQVANLTTSESRFAIAAVFRYPLGKGANAPVVGGKLGYDTKRFNIQQTLPNNDDTDVPNVYYKAIVPSAFFIYPASPKLAIRVNAGFLAVTNTGDIQKSSQYGAATVSGFDVGAGVDYNVTQNIFVRAAGMVQTFGFTFKGDPMSKANTRDNDGTTQEVMGARDTYFGGAVTLGYAY